MDILISSNFERFIFEVFDRDGKATAEAFRKLSSEGFFYRIPGAKAKMGSTDLRRFCRS